MNELNSIFLPFTTYKCALDKLLSECEDIKKEIVGVSEEQRPIYELTIGNGTEKIVIWSQMHGNESSGTRGLLHWLQNKAYRQFTNVYTIVILPMLNPDGATTYLRRNAHGIDINRDARKVATREMQLLQSRLLYHKPILALNLHDQRSIFGVGDTSQPAGLSFLAPSISPVKEMTLAREVAMRVIGNIVSELPAMYQNKVGRYNDDYYPTAIGEWVMQQQIPCVLVETGVLHANDYNRDCGVDAHIQIFNAAISAIQDLGNAPPVKRYWEIPENKETFIDLVIANAVLSGEPTYYDLGFTKNFRVNGHELEVYWVLTEFGDLHFKHAYQYVHEGEVIVKLNDIKHMINRRLDLKY